LQLKATVHSDNTVSGTVRIGFAKSLAVLAGGTSGLLDELKSGQDSPCDFGGKTGTMHDFDDGTYVGVDCTFSGITLAQFNSGGDGPQLARVGDSFRLTGQLNMLDSLGNSLGGSLGGSQNPTSPNPLPTDLSSLLPSGFPTDLSSLLPSGFPTDLSSLLPSGFPTDLSGLPSGLSSLLPSGFPPDLSGLPSGLPTALSGLPSGLPTDLSSLLPSGLPG